MKGLYAYFAYGSNLLPERLFQRCPTAVPYAPAILPNYRLTERLYADVDYAPGEQVHGFVYLLRAHDVARLDRYEGYPQIYRRYTVDVILGDGTELPALIYEMTPKNDLHLYTPRQRPTHSHYDPPALIVQMLFPAAVPGQIHRRCSRSTV